MILEDSINGTWYASITDHDIFDAMWTYQPMFPGIRYLCLNLNHNGFLKPVPEVMIQEGKRWHVMNVSKVEDNRYTRTYLVYIAEQDYKLLFPLKQRYRSVKQAFENNPFGSLQVRVDPALEDEVRLNKIKCGPGRTRREMLHELLYRHRLECAITDDHGGTVYIFKPGNANAFGSHVRPFRYSLVNISMGKKFLEFIINESKERVTTASFWGAGWFDPGLVFTNAMDDKLAGEKCLFVRKSSRGPGLSNFIACFVKPSRFVNVDLLCNIGVVDNPAMNELRHWRSVVKNTKSYICQTKTDGNVHFPLYNWIDGNFGDVQSMPTDVLLPAFSYRQDGGSTRYWYCKFPSTERDTSVNEGETLVIDPDLSLWKAGDGIARSVRAGVVVNRDKLGEIMGKTSVNPRDLYFDIRISNNRSARIWVHTTEKAAGAHMTLHFDASQGKTRQVRLDDSGITLTAGNRTVKITDNLVKVT